METKPALTPASFAILLSLAAGEKHGYAIMQDVAAPGQGFRIGPGTLYRSIKQLRSEGLIEESESRMDPTLDDQRRRYYRLTKRGRQAFRAEAQRLAQLVGKAANTGLIPGWSAPR